MVINYHFYYQHITIRIPTHHEFPLHIYQYLLCCQCISLHFRIKNLELEHFRVDWMPPKCCLWVYQGSKVTSKRDFRVLKKNFTFEIKSFETYPNRRIWSRKWLQCINSRRGKQFDPCNYLFQLKNLHTWFFVLFEENRVLGSLWTPDRPISNTSVASNRLENVQAWGF